MKVKIADLTITNGDASGGGIYNGGGTVTVTNSHVDVNLGGFGGGIYNDGGTLTVTNSTVNGNSTPSGGIGGGIYNNNGTLTITNSHVDGNSASGAFPFGGGGILNNNGTLKITSSHVDGNSASADYPSGGGGILNFGGNLTVSNSTLSGNSATGSDALGGGIENRGGGNLTVSNSTLGGVMGNSAIFGGGIGNQSGIMTINSSTFAGNTAIDGGGILNEDRPAQSTTPPSRATVPRVPSRATRTVARSTVATSTGSLFSASATPPLRGTPRMDPAPTSTFTRIPPTQPPPHSPARCWLRAAWVTRHVSIPPGTFDDYGYNISSDGSCGFSGTSLNGTDPMLGALASNGGPTQTRALAPLSPAVDAIPGVSLSCPSTSGGPFDRKGPLATSAPTSSRRRGSPR